jgi:hypothetical protein
MNPMRPGFPVYHPAMTIDTAIPQGMAPPADVAQPPNNIRNLINRLRQGIMPQQPTPANEPPPGEAPPFAPPAPPMRSVLKNASPNAR